jgi:pyrroloquinoline quinone (PQQ) biosynthesis protein C
MEAEIEEPLAPPLGPITSSMESGQQPHERLHEPAFAHPQPDDPVTAVAEIDALRERWNVLRHPFHARWAAGELTYAEIARYAAEYRWAVLVRAALAELTSDREHARQEREQVLLWEAFARACGAAPAPPSPATADCALAWLAGEDRLERLAVLYAIDSAEPTIARTQLRGLLDHYGFKGSPATEYFVASVERDSVDVAAARALLLAHARPADAARMTERAEAALAGSWRLLDGVRA